MARRPAVLFGVCALLVSLRCWACVAPVGISQAEADRRDMKQQRKIASDLSREADAIFIGKVVRDDDEAGIVEIQVMELLKGQASGTQSARYDPNERDIGCTRSFTFRQVWPGVEHDYLFYTKASVVLRAGSLTRDKWDLSLTDEKKIISKVVSGR